MTRSLNSRKTAKEQTRQYRKAERKRKNSQIDRESIKPRNASGVERLKRVHSDVSDDNARNPAKQGHKNAFRQDLRRNPQTAGSECATQCDFPRTRCAMGQEQIR